MLFDAIDFLSWEWLVAAHLTVAMVIGLPFLLAWARTRIAPPAPPRPRDGDEG